MANSFNDLSQVLAELLPTFPPQVLSATGAGQAVNVEEVGMNLINAQLIVGDANSLTSLAVKMQAALDDGSGAADAGTWTDITGLDGTDVTFTTITADPTTTGAVPQTIAFKMPEPSSYSTGPYVWVRAYATLVGTDILMAVTLLATRKYDQLATNVAAPGNAGNNVIN